MDAIDRIGVLRVGGVAEDDSGLTSQQSVASFPRWNVQLRRWVWRETVLRTRTRFEPLPCAIGANGADVVTSGQLDLMAAVVVPLPRMYTVGHVLVGMPLCRLWVDDVDVGRACRACTQ